MNEPSEFPSGIEHTRVQVPPASTTTYTTPQKPASGASSGFSGDLRSLDRLLEQSQLPNGPTVVRGYKLLMKIGQGGFGCVWQAQNLKTDEIVAIKFLVREDRDTAGILEEVRYMAKVQGQAGVIAVREVEDVGIPPYFVPYCVMQLASNGSLQELVKTQSLTRADAVRHFTAIVNTLSYIHNRHIVHSDLKLANVLLNDANEPLIADFGQAQHNTHSSAQGTLFYMAPERATIERQRPDPRWDVYSLGAMLYMMLTGKLPRYSKELSDQIRSASDYEQKLRVYREGLAAAPQPDEHWKLCDRDLAWIIDQCLALDPDKRPSDAGSVKKLLDRRRYLRRMKPMIRLGVAATVAFLGLIIPTSIIFANRYIEQKKEGIEQSVRVALDQKASLGCQIIEDFLAERVNFTEYHANNPERCPPELRLRLEKAARMIQGEPRGDPLTIIPAAQRDYFDKWLTEKIYPVLARRHPNSRKSLTLMVVVEDPGNPNKARGFIMSRLEGTDGETMPLTLSPREDRTLNEGIYRRNFAHRDYFNGIRNYFEDHEQFDAFPVIQKTHISHAFLSHALSREKTGSETAADYCWKLSVATPIWAEVPTIQNGQIEPSGKAVGLLMCGIFVKQDLEDAFGLSRDHESGASEFVLLNSRGAWVLHHGDYRERLLDNVEGRSVQRRDPQCYHDLRKDFADKCGSRASETFHELMTRHATPPDGRTRAQPVSSLDYVDLLKADQNWPSEIASLNRFNPYRNSYYSALRDSAAAWTFIAQLDRARTLGEVDRIQKEFLVTAIYIVAGLLIVVVILWVWLIRLVHRGEFAANG